MAPPRGATLKRRLAAMLYDGMLLIGLWIVTLFFLVAANGGEAVTGALVQSFLFVEAFAYMAWSWTGVGQTIGMQAWRLHAVNAADLRHGLTLEQSTRRCIGAMLGVLCLGIGYLRVLWDPQRLTWSDLWSGSIIVHDPNFSPPDAA